MNIEEKAKAYDKALEKTRIYRDNAKAVENYAAVARYENIFPELRESKNERIRQQLLWLCDEWEHNPERRTIPTDIGNIKQIRRYLEKQKEHHIPWYDYQKSKEAGYTIVPNEEYEQLIKQKEQKPTIWTEEDEKNLCELLAYGETRLGLRRWIAGLPEKIKGLQQKPAEWSEEDELMRTVIIQTLERFGGRGTTGMQIDWLKSLHPQPHWKPSEEQEEPEYYQHFDPDC